MYIAHERFRLKRRRILGASAPLSLGTHMKLVFSAIYKAGSKAANSDGPVMLTSAADLSSFGYFQRSTIKET